jgi:hypothetical protein
MAGGLNYAPEDVRTSEMMVASISGSGVAFAFMPHNVGEEPQIVAIAPKIAKLHEIRIGDTIEVGYVENFPEHLERVPWRAVAIYKRTDGTEKAMAGIKPTEARKTIESQVLNIVMGGEVWNRAEMYVELFNEAFTSVTASEVERARYEAIGHSLLRLHDTGSIACARVYGPAKKNATALYYAKSTHVLGRALMGLDDLNTGAEP